MNTLALQRLLKRLGFDPGPLDGIPGRKTTAAVKAFQAAHRLVVDGIVGPATLAALRAAERGPSAGQPVAAAAAAKADPSSAGYPATPWVDSAFSTLGLLEARGAANDPTIMGWARNLPKAVRGYFLARGDATPWCGLFVHNALAVTLPEEPMPANPLGALQWGYAAPWGQTLPGPTFGAIAMKRRPGAAGSGHVFFVTGADAHYVEGIGGNQSDSVSVASFRRDEVVAYRWPLTVPKPARLWTPPRGQSALSTREA